MSKPDLDLTPRHPIGVVSNRTGVAPDLLRAWERRYGAVVPHRTETGRRLYSDRDIKRLSLLRRLVAGGRRISDVAGLGLEQLVETAEEDRRAMARDPETSDEAAGITSNGYLAAALDAVARLDSTALETVLSDAALSMSPIELRGEVITPLLREIGARWRTGSVRVVHEHLASAIIRAFVDGMRHRSTGGSQPKVIVATPSGQRHELGALMAAAAAEEVGWEAIYFGADLAAEEIASGARQLAVGAVAVSIVYVADRYRLAEQLRNLRDAVGEAMPILVGGRAAPTVKQVLEEINATLVEDVADLQYQLEELMGRGVG
jgi:DNA-binding transcriptional MerR regulator/methylmalonyl-CoA mutase cobalamin-binding subunit